MSASLVGSEMCIRDRCHPSARTSRHPSRSRSCGSSAGGPAPTCASPARAPRCRPGRGAK
eukprot:4578989-Alexandrium_andersonii.AAC.1